MSDQTYAEFAGSDLEKQDSCQGSCGNTIKKPAQTDTVTNFETAVSFESIRDHLDAGKTLTSNEMDLIADQAIQYIRAMLATFGENDCSIDEYDGSDGELIFDVSGGDLAVLIGRHGKTLDALQTIITSLMSSRMKFYYPIVLDIEGYKDRRKKKIQQIAHNAVIRARKTKRIVKLNPMIASERRMVHLALMHERDIDTYSEGEEPYRGVVVAYSKGSSSRKKPYLSGDTLSTTQNDPYANVQENLYDPENEYKNSFGGNDYNHTEAYSNEN